MNRIAELQIQSPMLLTNRRQQITRATISAFRRHGLLDNTSLASAKGEISQSNLYDCVASTGNVPFAVREHLAFRCEGKLDHILEHYRDPYTRLVRAIEAMVDMIGRNHREGLYFARYREINTAEDCRLTCKVESFLIDYEVRFGALPLGKPRLITGLLSIVPAMMSFQDRDLRGFSQDEIEQEASRFILAGLGIPEPRHVLAGYEDIGLPKTSVARNQNTIMDKKSYGRGSYRPSLNLNMLPVLRELLRLRNITQAASAANMSQSAMSNALSRLRKYFDDELLFRAGKDLILSEKAERLELAIGEPLRLLEMLLGAGTFDPAKASGRIRIASPDYMTMMLGAELVRKLCNVGPDLLVRFSPMDDLTCQALAAGELDLAFVTQDELASASSKIKSQPLIEVDMVLVASANGAAFGSSQKVLPEAAVGTAPSRLFPNKDGMFEVASISSMLIPFLLEEISDEVAVPWLVAERLLKVTNTRIVDTREPLPKLSIFMAWNEARVGDPLISWLRDLVLELANLSARDDRKQPPSPKFARHGRMSLGN